MPKQPLTPSKPPFTPLSSSHRPRGSVRKKYQLPQPTPGQFIEDDEMDMDNDGDITQSNPPAAPRRSDTAHPPQAFASTGTQHSSGRKPYVASDTLSGSNSQGSLEFLNKLLNAAPTTSPKQTSGTWTPPWHTPAARRAMGHTTTIDPWSQL
ncbi:hypothetical protein LTS18_010609 [Coniosporium uncinatum]|uniref:Uncharacterized protein n=1 Tax=Coniosporium uncinatum TaxID=93489 RepID=A0ACC3DW91_9PEZI|nr:hypothetical protein LTS18_010609 [Coniosporium uncinatum]